MQEIIQNLLNGSFNYEKGNIDFSCSRLELSLSAGEKKEGSFTVFGQKNKLLHGYVTSSDLRMECLTPEVSGTQEEVLFCFHAENLEEGEVVKGEFYVVSNQGESYLPFVASVEHTVVASSMGQIKNLFHFANLAKSNWDEAVKIFYSNAFHNIFKGNERQYYPAYRGLSRYPGNEQNVEEFLLHVNKKQKMEYLVEEKEIRMDNPQGVAAASITIVRNGWGYTRLFLEAEGDFLSVEKDSLNDDDFLGNYCRLPIYVREDSLHAGNNYGQIRLFNHDIHICVPVLVTVKEAGYCTQGSFRREKRHLILQLMEYYQAFRLKKISSSTWQKEAGKLAERLASIDDRDVQARLFQAQILITGGRYNEAGWILNHTEEMLNGQGERADTLWAYYLYLTTLVRREESYVNEVTEQIEQLYREYPHAWRIGWLLLYLSEAYGKSGSGRWLFLEEQYNRGCKSPVIYIEAVQLLQANPTLLMKLSGFERQILLFASRKECLTQDMAEQIVYLAEREKEFSGAVFEILTACYRIKAGTDVLRAVCSLLIKGNKVDNRYFPWYEKAVEQEIRITRLYDYYMLSLNLEQKEMLPKMVLMYFSYYSNLDYEHNACLYANVFRYRDKLPELYANYRIAIERFVTEQIVKGHINRNLAYLYKNILTPQMITPEAANSLARLMFMNQIQIERDDIVNVIVYQPRAGVEHVYPVSFGEALVPLFGSEYTLLLEDMAGNRYIAQAAYYTEKLMLPGKLAKYIEEEASEAIGFDVYICEKSKNGEQISEKTQQRFRRLLESPVIDVEYKKEICIMLMQYYYDNDYIQELDEYLDRMDVSFLEPLQRGKLIRLLVLRGNYEKAYEWIEKYGPFYTDAKTLVRLCNHLLERKFYLEDSYLLGIIVYAFRKGKYSEQMLTYLIMYYRGLTRDLRNMWKAAEAFDIDTGKLCERMLVQMLFSGSYVGEQEEIFKRYVQRGAKPDIEIAFLSQCAYDYFVNQKVTDRFLFEEMLRIYRQGENLNQVCKLALLKYYAENQSDITEAIGPLLKKFLQEMLMKRIYLNFFREYTGMFELQQMADKTVIEYHTHPEAKAVLHYVLECMDGTEGTYFTEEMKKAFGGVCFREFVLFFGESLQYYIVEEKDGNEQLTESGSLQNNDTFLTVGDNKFSLTNDIVTSSVLQDYDTFDTLLTEYYYKDFMVKHLFRFK